MIVFFAIPLTSCEKDPEPVLTKPTITLKLSEESPQNIIILSWIPSDAEEAAIQMSRLIILEM